MSQPRDEAPAQVDPSLLRELEDAERAARPLEAVVFLRRGEAAGTPTPDQTERDVAKLLRSAERDTGERAAAVNVFRNLHSFALAASPSFIRSVLRDERVASARSNRGPSEPDR
jgi:transposase